VTFAPDGIRFATRGAADDCLRVWDVRNLSERAGPVGTVRGLTAVHATANAAWSPDGKLVAAGAAVRKSEGAGRVLVYDVAALETGSKAAPPAAGAAGSSAGAAGAAGSVGWGAGLTDADAAYSLSVAPGVSAIALLWHPRINQLALGCSDGSTRVYYDPQLSVKGALLSTARAPKRREVADDDAMPVGVIIAPAALGGGGKGKRAVGLADALAEASGVGRKRKYGDVSRRPDLPSVSATAPSGPDVLASSSRTFTQFYMQSRSKEVNLREQDPTEVLRAYGARQAAAAAAAGGGSGGAAASSAAGPALAAGGAGGGDVRGPQPLAGPAPTVTGFYTKAYAATQPRQVLDTKTLEQEMEETGRRQ
jgi:hypothetical protein